MTRFVVSAVADSGGPFGQLCRALTTILMFQILWVVLVGRTKMTLMMLRVTVPSHTDLVLKAVTTTTVIMFALAQVRDEWHLSMEVSFRLVQL
jgi:uncharacterized membrane protein YqjE